MNTLMVVDDSDVMRNQIARCEEDGVLKIVALAEDGEQAVRLFEEKQPEYITMDLTMPNMDGLEAIEKIVSINPDVKILVISALSDKITGIQALELGASGFICKPFTDEELVLALYELVSEEL